MWAGLGAANVSGPAAGESLGSLTGLPCGREGAVCLERLPHSEAAEPKAAPPPPVPPPTPRPPTVLGRSGLKASPS